MAGPIFPALRGVCLGLQSVGFRLEVTEKGGRVEAADALEGEFGRYDGHTPYKVLFSVKATDVISIETNGIRRVRVIP